MHSPAPPQLSCRPLPALPDTRPGCCPRRPLPRSVTASPCTGTAEAGGGRDQCGATAPPRQALHPARASRPPARARFQRGGRLAIASPLLCSPRGASDPRAFPNSQRSHASVSSTSAHCYVVHLQMPRPPAGDCWLRTRTMPEGRPAEGRTRGPPCAGLDALCLCVSSFHREAGLFS